MIKINAKETRKNLKYVEIKHFFIKISLQDIVIKNLWINEEE